MMSGLAGSIYEVRPVRIGRPARRWPFVVVIAAGVFLAAVVTKPWSWSSATPPSPVAVVDRPAQVASAAPEPVANVQTHGLPAGLDLGGTGGR
jgi:hypothetical protein